jgi:hypothetical protein
MRLIFLVGITLLFYPTLIKPRANLALALQERYVLLFLSAAGSFWLSLLGCALLFQWQSR